MQKIWADRIVKIFHTFHYHPYTDNWYLLLLSLFQIFVRMKDLVFCQIHDLVIISLPKMWDILRNLLSRLHVVILFITMLIFHPHWDSRNGVNHLLSIHYKNLQIIVWYFNSNVFGSIHPNCNDSKSIYYKITYRIRKMKLVMNFLFYKKNKVKHTF